jgi:hypothetical protein
MVDELKAQDRDERTRIPCPNCSFQFDPVQIAKLLPPEVLRAERARRNGLKPRPRLGGPGRPKGLARCPSCLSKFTLPEFRAHLLPCLTAKLEQYKSSYEHIRVRPMDTTEYRDFRVIEIRQETVVLYKLSNMQNVEIPLRAIREITPAVNDEPAVMTLRGALRWREDIQRWRFST